MRYGHVSMIKNYDALHVHRCAECTLNHQFIFDKAYRFHQVLLLLQFTIRTIYYCKTHLHDVNYGDYLPMYMFRDRPQDVSLLVEPVVILSHGSA